MFFVRKSRYKNAVLEIDHLNDVIVGYEGLLKKSEMEIDRLSDLNRSLQASCGGHKNAANVYKSQRDTARSELKKIKGVLDKKKSKPKKSTKSKKKPAKK